MAGVEGAPGPLGLGVAGRLEVTVLVDNRPGPGLRGAWGLSILASTPGARILFDAGPDPGVLAENAGRLGVNLSTVDYAVVSHEHLDHIGGFPAVARARPGLRVYAPSRMSLDAIHWLERLGFRVERVEDTTPIAPGVAVVGQLHGPPWEQALAVNVEGRGLVVLVGCSHPGVARLVHKASMDLGVRPYAVIGGFHTAWSTPRELESVVEDLLSLGVERIAPIHCSGDGIRRLLAGKHPEHYLDVKAGGRVEF